MRRTPALIAVALVAAAGGAASPVGAAPPKPFSRTVTFVDRTPDPSAYLLGPEHCMGRLPAEEPVPVALPARGVVSISIDGFDGEWSLMVTDADGQVVATADADPPATESTRFRVKKGMKINILPCNIAGTFEAQLTYAYAPG